MPYLKIGHPLPDQVDDRDRQDERQEESGQDEALQPAPETADHEGNGERRQRPWDNGEENEVAVFQTATLKMRSEKQFHIVGEADPFPFADQRRIGEAELHHLDRRVEKHPSVDGNEGRHQRQGDQDFGASALQHSARPASRKMADAELPRRRPDLSTEHYSSASSAAFISATASAGSASPFTAAVKALPAASNIGPATPANFDLRVVDHVRRQHRIGRVRLHRLVFGGVGDRLLRRDMARGRPENALLDDPRHHFEARPHASRASAPCRHCWGSRRRASRSRCRGG